MFRMTHQIHLNVTKLLGRTDRLPQRGPEAALAQAVLGGHWFIAFVGRRNAKWPNGNSFLSKDST